MEATFTQLVVVPWGPHHRRHVAAARRGGSHGVVGKSRDIVFCRSHFLWNLIDHAPQTKRAACPARSVAVLGACESIASPETRISVEVFEQR